MAVQNTRSRKPLLIGVGLVAVVLIAVGVWASSESPEPLAESTLPPELSVDALKKRADDPSALRNEMRREDLTEEQRRELRHNMREVMQSRMAERVDEYFGAAEEDRLAILDRHIDEWEKRRAEWEQNRRDRDRDRNDREDGKEGRRDDRRGRFASQSKQERKERSESRSADERGRRMAYVNAMRTRMQERGIEMRGPGGGRGGPGGPGRGPGGPRGGPGRGGGGRP